MAITLSYFILLTKNKNKNKKSLSSKKMYLRLFISWEINSKFKNWEKKIKIKIKNKSP